MTGGIEPERVLDVQRVTDAALARLELDPLLSELLDRIREVLEADTAAILLLDEASDDLVARAAKGLEEEVERGTRIPVGGGFAGRVAAECRPIFIPDVDHADILNPLLREKGLKSLLGVPLMVEGRVLGVWHVGSLTPREFTADDAELLALVGDRAALAIDRAQLYEREHRIAETLQRSLLPEELVTLPAVDVAARYVASAEAADIGGDWFDAIALPDGQVGVAIGDVVGRGLRAATLMGQLRNALRAYALEGREPAEIAELLGRLIRETSPGATATMVYLSYAPDTGQATVVNAGHLPPILVDPDGDAVFARLEPSVPLGAIRHPRYEHGVVAIDPGTTLVLYTDGIVERPDEDLQTGLERIREAAGRAPIGAAERCDALVAELLSERAVPDDAAVLAFRPLALGDRLRERYPAQPESVPVMRRLVTRWLSDHAVPEEVAYDAVVAVSEAAANAIEHAYAPGDHASFEVTAALTGDGFELSVKDFGGWREPRGQHRGRGLMLMDAFMDDVNLLHSDNGTTVVLRRDLAQEAAA